MARNLHHGRCPGGSRDRVCPHRAIDRRESPPWISLFAVDTTSKGYTVGRKLDKLGLKTSDTAELSLVDVEVPVEDLLGVENADSPIWPKICPASGWALRITSYSARRRGPPSNSPCEYTTQRHVFGSAVASFQNTKFELGGVQGRRRRDGGGCRSRDGRPYSDELTPAEAASVKLSCTGERRSSHRSLSATTRWLWIHERSTRLRVCTPTTGCTIYGGTSEVMKVIIAKNMGL